MTPPSDLAVIVAAAARGDERAWKEIVQRFESSVRSFARRHRLGAHDEEEVAQRTWLALLQNIDRIHEPAALAGWIQTTARRESLRVLHDTSRAVPVAEIVTNEAVPDVNADLQEQRERREAVLETVRRLPPRHHALLELLLREPALSYKEISARLEMPIGSIGPTRERCMMRLRREPRVAALMDEAPPQRPTRAPRPRLDVL